MFHVYFEGDIYHAFKIDGYLRLSHFWSDKSITSGCQVVLGLLRCAGAYVQCQMPEEVNLSLCEVSGLIALWQLIPTPRNPAPDTHLTFATSAA